MQNVRPLFLLLGALLSPPARAHDADIVHVRVSFGPADGGAISQRLTMTPGTLLLLAPPVDRDGDGHVSSSELTAGAPVIQAGVLNEAPLSVDTTRCEVGVPRLELTEVAVALELRARCPPGLVTQRFRFLSILPRAYQVIVSLPDGGQRFARAEQQVVALTSERAPMSETTAARSLWQWVALGVEHILFGFDHLCFLLGLLLATRGALSVVALVSTFTVAHSLTLAATALQLVALRPPLAAFVEVAIAASLVWVGVENLVSSSRPRRRVALTFGFGLLHGFGFAQVLAGYGLGLGDEVARSLLGFNAGVELGQLAVIAVLTPVLTVVRRRPRLNGWVVRAGSLGVAGAGLFWTVERALAFTG